MSGQYKTRDKIKRELQMMQNNCERMQSHLYKIEQYFEQSGIDNSEKSALLFNLIEEVKRVIEVYRESVIG